jgi:ribosomal protein S14
MKSNCVLDKKKRSHVKFEEKKKIIRDLFLKNNNWSKPLKWWINLWLEIKITPSQLVNRCIFTGRSASVYRYYKSSRINLRQLGRRGFISGFSKSSW